MIMKKVLLLAFILLFFIVSMLNIRSSITGMPVKSELKESNFSYRVYFCSEHDCLVEMILLFNESRNIDCAIYNVNDALIEAGRTKQVRIVTDDHFKKNLSFIRKDSQSGLMHNKFCIFDNKTVLTGSFNPTSSRNDRNNLIIIDSQLLAANYEHEFQELWNGNSNMKTPEEDAKILLGGSEVENYFCPEDRCSENVIRLIDSANSSILFMAYSFTHKGIANELIIQQENKLDVRGVIDSSNNKDVFELLSFQGIDVKLDMKKGLMHHKVFIIDNETVITGSFNPTYNADKNNDENILIIHNKGLALKYLQEFDEVFSQ